jgi:hypothetical protein
MVRTYRIILSLHKNRPSNVKCGEFKILNTRNCPEMSGSRICNHILSRSLVVTVEYGVSIDLNIRKWLELTALYFLCTKTGLPMLNAVSLNTRNCPEMGGSPICNHILSGNLVVSVKQSVNHASYMPGNG